MTDNGNHWEPSRPTSTIPRIGTVDEFIACAIGPRKPLAEGEKPTIPHGVALCVEKFKRAGSKVYCLIWTGRGKACLAQEDPTEYTTKTGSVIAGRRLAERLGTTFDARTR